MKLPLPKNQSFDNSSTASEESINKAWEHFNKITTKFFKDFSNNKAHLEAFDLSTKDKEPLYIKKGLLKEQIESFYFLGSFFYRKGSYEKSFAVFRSVVYLDYSDIRGWKGLGDSLYALKKFSTAQKVYLCTFQQHPEDLESLFREATCHVSLNDFAKAEKTIDQVLSLSYQKPNYTEIRKMALKLKALLPV